MTVGLLLAGATLNPALAVGTDALPEPAHHPRDRGGQLSLVRLVKNINPGSAGSNAAQFTVLNGAVFFRANDGPRGAELWRSDGTTRAPSC